jgi:hypothetical protein
MSKRAFDYGAWMSKRDLEVGPIETKDSTFVKWRLLESFGYSFNHVGSWEVLECCGEKVVMLF